MGIRTSHLSYVFPSPCLFYLLNVTWLGWGGRLYHRKVTSSQSPWFSDKPMPPVPGSPENLRHFIPSFWHSSLPYWSLIIWSNDNRLCAFYVRDTLFSEEVPVKNGPFQLLLFRSGIHYLFLSTNLCFCFQLSQLSMPALPSNPVFVPTPPGFLVSICAVSAKHLLNLHSNEWASPLPWWPSQTQGWHLGSDVLASPDPRDRAQTHFQLALGSCLLQSEIVTIAFGLFSSIPLSKYIQNKMEMEICRFFL